MNFTQNEIGTFDISVPTRDIVGMDLYLEDVSVYQDDTLIIDGLIKSPFVYPELPDSISNPLFTSLKCDENLGRLANESSADLHFQDTFISVAVATLLTNTQFSSWIINDATTLNDITVTVDLRNKESLWAQIIAVCEASRTATFVRYGGYSGGNYLLDIGYFRIRRNVPKAVWSSNILTPPRFSEANTEPIKILYPISGASPDLPVNLDAALAIDPTLNDPSQDYQILTGTGSIRNNTISKGIAVRKSYEQVKTKNDSSPSQAELNETALTLYNVASEEMEASQSSISLSVKITSEVTPQLNDAIWLESRIYETVYDLYTEEYTNIQSFDISGYFRIVGLSADFRERFEVYNPYIEAFVGNAVYELELVQGDKRITKSATEILLEKSEKTDTFDNLQATVGGGVLGVQNVTVQQDTVAANCNYSGVLDGREFDFAIPAAPVGATDIIVTVKDVTPNNYIFKVTSYGSIGGTYTLCVQNSNTNDWDLSDSASITITVFYT